MFDLLDGCPIVGVLDADGRFLVSLATAIGILADKAEEPELFEAIQHELRAWSLAKGYTYEC